MPPDKLLAWLHGEIQTPPFSAPARIEAGVLLRRLQRGEKLGLPQSRAMPTLGARCHELRIQDGRLAWRIIYRVDEDAIVIIEVVTKKSAKTPRHVLEACRQRLRRYDETVKGRGD